MPHSQDYTTAPAFQRALLAHIRHRAADQQVDPQRLQRLIAFDRFLARLLDSGHISWLVKGGYALELRVHGRARATKDIDLTIPHPGDLAPEGHPPLQAVRDLLQNGAERDLGDHFAFVVGPPTQDLDGPPYGGARFTVETRIGTRIFSAFHLDVSLGDSVLHAAEWLTGEPLLEFAGIPPVTVPVLSAEQQFAEKIHAFTLPRGGQLNTRVKDLVDLALFIELGQLDAARVRECLHATFERRKTHDLPLVLDAPPQDWAARYTALASECGLRSTTLEDAFQVVSDYWIGLGFR